MEWLGLTCGCGPDDSDGDSVAASKPVDLDGLPGYWTGKAKSMDQGWCVTPVKDNPTLALLLIAQIYGGLRVITGQSQTRHALQADKPGL